MAWHDDEIILHTFFVAFLMNGGGQPGNLNAFHDITDLKDSNLFQTKLFFGAVVHKKVVTKLKDTKPNVTGSNAGLMSVWALTLGHTIQAATLFIMYQETLRILGAINKLIAMSEHRPASLNGIR